MAVSTSGVSPGQTITSAKIVEIINLANSNETALSGKASTSHTHTASNVTDFNAAVRNVLPNGRVTTTATTLTSSDDILYVDGAVTVTVGSGILAPTVVQIGTGQFTLAAGSGVTLQGHLKSAGQWQGLSIFPRPGVAGTFIVVGGVA